MESSVKAERARLIKEMSTTDPTSEAYEALVKRYNALKDDRKIDFNGIAQSVIKAAGPVVLGLMIIGFEKRGGAFVSQASKFIKF